MQELARPTADARAEDRPAKKLVGRALGFAGHVIVFTMVCLLLLVVAGFLPTLIVALSWGIGLAAHGFFAVAAPLLRAPLEARAEQTLALSAPPAPATPAAPARLAAPGPSTRGLEELSAAIAHEIRSPITAAKSLVQQIAEDPASPDNAEYASVAVAELDRVERSIAHLLRFARDEALEPADVRMVDVVQAAVETMRDRAARQGATLATSIEESGTMRGDPEKLRRVVENLVGNALDAVRDAKTEGARVEVASGQNLAGDEIWVAVRDNGPGIPSEALPRIFSPFFTTKEGGTGLGLALAKKTAEAHGGTLEASTRRSGGAELLLVVPRAARRVPSEEQA